MTSMPPDPSVPDRQRDMIRQEITQFLSDPLSLPDEFTNWLASFIPLQQLTGTVTPTPATSANPVAGSPGLV